MCPDYAQIWLLFFFRDSGSSPTLCILSILPSHAPMRKGSFLASGKMCGIAACFRRSQTCGLPNDIAIVGYISSADLGGIPRYLKYLLSTYFS